jgi:prephenate dehydratase
MYGLHIVASGIESDKRNFTRFLVLTHVTALNGESANANKASIAFHLPHTRGSLANVLTILADHECNLTKIQSLPILGREWEYFMHIDLEFEAHGVFERAILAIRPHVNQLKILGEYQRGRKQVA